MRVVEMAGPPSPAEACESFLDLPGCSLLESVGSHGDLATHSFLSADPFVTLAAKRRHVRRRGLDGAEWEGDADPFEVLASELRRWSLPRMADADGLPPFRGGLIGWFAYDLLHHLERVPPPRFDDLRLPDLRVGFFDWTIAWDHSGGRAWIFSTGLPEPEGAARNARAKERLAFVADRLRSLPAQRKSAPVGTPTVAGVHPPATAFVGVAPPSLLAAPLVSESITRASAAPPTHAAGAPPTYFVAEAPGVRSTFSRRGYLEAVARCREYILAGDVFQVNLSQRLSLPYDDPPFTLYRRLCAANPAPFAAYLAGEGAAVLSASPERFLRLSGDRVETRPVKGTAGRGFTPRHDFALADDLHASDKDRAENVMIVDLLRNDLSRVAVDGSVRVPHLWRLERHPTVHHLVSTVTAQLRPGLGPVDLLRATFPGGSITGAPKVRAMEIIHELEPARRGVYCGSIGYVGFDGEADLSIAIRTVVLAAGRASFSVGGAVVADSDPAAEYRETLLKGAGLLRAWDAAAVPARAG